MEETFESSIFDEETSIIYGGFWERFGALVLDWLILLPLTVLNIFNSREWKSSSLLLLVSVISVIYKPLLEYLYGATPGKKALSLTIVSNTYEKISGTQAILRNIFEIVVGLSGILISLFEMPGMDKTPRTIRSFNDIDPSLIVSVLYSLFVFFLYLADAICLVVNDRKKALHDFIGKTVVIRKR